MIAGYRKKLKNIRTIISNKINDIIICEDVTNEVNKSYYTLIKIHDSDTIKNVLESIYNEDGVCNLPQELFCDLFVDVDTLNILMKYIEPRKLFLYLKSDMSSDYAQHMIIKNFLFECLKLNVSYPILYLLLNEYNINLKNNCEIFFNSFLDFSKLDKNINEKICVKRCCEIINKILTVNEHIAHKTSVKSIKLFEKKSKNNGYGNMVELYRDFKIKEIKYKNKNEFSLENLKLMAINIYKNKLKKPMIVLGVIFILIALILGICSLFRVNLPFSKYNGMNIIGTVNMAEK